MMLHEFVARTGYEPTPEIYSRIENAYYRSESQKDEFCKYFNLVVGEVLQELDEKIKELEKKLEEKSLLLARAEVSNEQLSKKYEALWKFEVVSNMTDEEYQDIEEFCGNMSLDNLRNDRKGKILSFIASYGFDKSKILLRKVKVRARLDNFVREKEVDSRMPLYVATDWNFLPFTCAGYDYEIVNGELHKL